MLAKSTFNTRDKMIREINAQTGVETSRPMTTDEQTASDVITAQELADKPMKDWQASMSATDSTIPRWFEDYISENSVTLAPGRAKDSYDAKVALRAGRPV
jgi:hypothetical protein